VIHFVLNCFTFSSELSCAPSAETRGSSPHGESDLPAMLADFMKYFRLQNVRHSQNQKN
jgi:hypothetical protein